MNQRAEIWNVLHDGDIAKIEGSVPGDLELLIEISYLSKMYGESYEAIELTLHECDLFRMNIWEDEKITDDLKEIERSETEILRTESEDCPIRLLTTNGIIDMNFGSHTLKLKNGPVITHESLCDACDAYWKKEKFEYNEK